MNTAIAITLIVAIYGLGCLIVAAIRDVAKTKHQGAANHCKTCTCNKETEA
ncbi:hypothetical protein ABZ876_08510 [Streptomyces sp. NPDC046931]|uniref:hypothetical protein n=1 Tax=Streptomyces sp. NPDC046931 TaxID=3154806 RepID=UPI0033D55C07